VASGDMTIRTRVGTMMEVFRSQAAGLFDVTRPDEWREYQKGIYGVQFVKPVKPIQRLLAVDREILVLSTSYTDLQPRVNQLAIDIIDRSDGRLERFRNTRAWGGGRHAR